MKKFNGPLVNYIVCFGLLLVCFVYIVGGQYSKQQVAKVEATARLDEHAEQVENDLLDVVKSLSHENTLLCERDAKTLKVVAEFEEENRRLKCSLSDAVKRLEDQQTEINSLIDQADDLRYKVEVLEKALDASHPAVKSLSHENTILCERDVKTFQMKAEFEDEDRRPDRRLRCSLCYSVTRLQELQTETDSLIDQTGDLENKISVLDNALDDQQTKTALLIHQNLYRDYNIRVLDKALDDQQTDTYSLIDQTEDLRYKVEVLEKALDALHPIIK